MKDLYYKIPFDYKKLSNGDDATKVTIEESLAQFISVVISTIFGEYKYDDENRIIEQNQIFENTNKVRWKKEFAYLKNKECTKLTYLC